MATYQTLQLRTADSSVVLSLIDNTTCWLEEDGWAPTIANLQSQTLGRRLPVEDVQEQMNVNVFGTTFLATLTKAKDLFWKAERYTRYNEGQPILFDVQYTSGSLYSMQVLGGSITTPTNYSDLLNVNELVGITLTFVRQGYLFKAEETSTTSTSTANPGIMSCTFPSTQPYLCPTTVILRGPTSDASGGYQPNATKLSGALLLAPTAASINLIQAEVMADGGIWTTVADTTYRASSGSVLRLTPNVANSAMTTFLSALTGLSTARAISGFAVVRNNNLSQSYQLSVKAGKGTTFALSNIGVDQWIAVPNTTTNPQVISLGTQYARNGFDVWQLSVIASATGGSIDIDTIVFLVMDTPASSILTIPGSDGLGRMFGASAALTYRVEHRMLTDIQPAVAVASSTATVYTSYQGVANLLSTGSTLAALWLGTSGAYWTTPNVGNTAVQSYQLQALRLPSTIIAS